MAAKNIESFPGQIEVTSDLTVDTNTLHVDSATHRVGVGKTNPGYTVDVNGTLNASAFYVNGSEFTGGGGGGGGGPDPWTESGSDIYYTTGNVGIGVTNPAKQLHVAGPMRISGPVDVDLSVNASPLALNVSTPVKANGTVLSFTGQHMCFPEGLMEQGLVVSAKNNKYVSLNGPLTTGSLAIRSSEALPVVSLSNVANDGAVFGVVDHFEQSGTTRTQKIGIGIVKQDKEVGDNRVVVNSLGEGGIWVANTNGNVASGDFLTTSHLPGYAQKQDEPFRSNYTVAKSTMDCNFNPLELPTQVILKDEDGNNVLNSYGRLQWVDDPEGVTTPEYEIRYLDVSGTPTDEANAVHRAVFIGCTYHCG